MRIHCLAAAQTHPYCSTASRQVLRSSHLEGSASNHILIPKFLASSTSRCASAFRAAPPPRLRATARGDFRPYVSRKAKERQISRAVREKGISAESQTGKENPELSAVMADGSAEEDGIRVLDMGDYFSKDAGKVSKFCEQLREVCHTIGFFYVKNHGISQDLCDSFLRSSHEFFDLPAAIKKQIDYRKSAHFRGYMEIGVENTAGLTDFREQVEFGSEEAADVDVVDGHIDNWVYPVYRRLRGPNQWPAEEILPDFKPIALEYMDKLGSLAMHIMQALALSLGLRKSYFDSTFQHGAHYQMKVARYPPKSDLQTGESSGAFGVGAHSDSGYVSLLLQDTVGGLQAVTKEGEWTDVPPKMGTFVVNLGEMLQLATGGYYLATVHRVQSQTGSASRYSVPFFFNPKLETDIRAININAGDLVENRGRTRSPSPAEKQGVYKTHGGKNNLVPIFGNNAFKSYARSHSECMREHHADLLKSDGQPAWNKIEEVTPKPG